MRLNINDVKTSIRTAVQQYTGIQITDDDKHLLATDDAAIIADFLYVMKDLEEKYGSAIYTIFESNDYTVFTVNNFAQKIVEACAETAAENG